MRKCFEHPLLLVGAASILAACHTASREALVPKPESEQVVRDEVKDLYMKASVAPRQSKEQQRLISKMAREAANGKELLLVMRAAEGVFPSGAASAEQTQVYATVTTKMIEAATLDQLIDYAAQYPVDSAQARRFADRMLELGNRSDDARVWYRIRAAAYHLGLSDLQHQAQARAEQLAPR
jgi:hypothetical protein